MKLTLGIRWLALWAGLAWMAFPTAAGAGRPPRIEEEITIPCAAVEAWAAWTTSEGLRSFLTRSARIAPKEGGEYVVGIGGVDPTLLTSLRPSILHLDPVRQLTFQWIIPLPDVAGRDPMTVVTVRIEPLTALKTRVRLEHAGWIAGEEKTEAFAYSKRAWKVALRNLREVLTVRGRRAFHLEGRRNRPNAHPARPGGRCGGTPG